MRSVSHNPVYNARIPLMFFRSYTPYVFCLLLPVLLLATESRADQWQTPAIELARKIAAATGPGAVALEVVNRSSLENAAANEIRRRLLDQLGSLGLHSVVTEQAAATIQVTLSENLQDYVWVAEIHLGNNESSVVMVTLPRPEGVAADRPASLTIHKALIWTADTRILDVALPAGTPLHMIVLEPENIILYELQSGRWQPQQLLTITHSQPWPRDLRGRLVLQKDHLFDAYLPGVVCRSAPAAPLAMTCRESDDPWPLFPGQSPVSAFFAPKRNFFTGVLSPGIQKQTTTS